MTTTRDNKPLIPSGSGRRLGWGVADTALSSLTNFTLVLLVARAVNPRAFGGFSLGYATYLMAVGISRAISSEPLVIRYSARSEQDWRRGTGLAAGTAIMVGFVVGAGCLAFGLSRGGVMATPFRVLGATMPALLVQDCWRGAFVTQGRPDKAFVNDLVWAIALIPPAVFLTLLKTRSIGAFFLAWAGSATVAAVVGLWQARVFPNVSGARTWLREQRDLIPRFVGEFVTLGAASQVASYAVAALAGLAAAGALRGAGVIMAPMGVVMSGVGFVAVPEGVRVLRESPDRLRRLCVLVAAGLSVAMLGWGGLALLTPTRVGHALLGDVWAIARPLVVPVALSMAGIGFAAGAGNGIRTLGAARESLRARLLISPVLVVASVVGAILGGVGGAAWGIAIGQITGAVLWWRYFLTALRQHGRGGGVPDFPQALAVETSASGTARHIGPFAGDMFTGD